MTTPEPPADQPYNLGQQPYYVEPPIAGLPYNAEPPPQPPAGTQPYYPPAPPAQQYYPGPYQPGPYQQPGQYPYAPYPQAPSTNGMAIAAMVLGILWIYWIGSILALVFGYVARDQIKRTGQSGDGMAIAGIVLGWVGVGFLILGLVFWGSLWAGV
jgi:hypothetical protein